MFTISCNFRIGRLAPALAAALLALPLGLAAPQDARGQEREIRVLNQKVEKLESDLRSVIKYLSDTPEDKRGSLETRSDLSSEFRPDMEVRLSALENEIRNLTGQVETALHRVDQLNRRLEKLARDYEFRFQQLEGGNGGAIPERDGASGVPGETGGDAGEVGPSQADAPPPSDGFPESGKSANQALPAGEPMAQYDAALALLRQDDYTGATQAFQTFLAQYPDHELTPNALYWLGESHYVQGDYAPAARAFLKAYDGYPKSAKASGSLLKLALSLSEIGQKKDACAALRTFSQEFPDASPVEKTRAQDARRKLNCP